MAQPRHSTHRRDSESELFRADYLETKLIQEFSDPDLDHTETRLEPNPQSLVQYELLDAVNGADLGPDRETAMTRVKAALVPPAQSAAQSPPRWEFEC